MNETLGAGAAKTGVLHTVGVKTMMVLSAPVVGWAALAGIVGWELWKARKGDKQLKEKAAAAA